MGKHVAPRRESPVPEWFVRWLRPTADAFRFAGSGQEKLGIFRKFHLFSLTRLVFLDILSLLDFRASGRLDSFSSFWPLSRAGRFK